MFFLDLIHFFYFQKVVFFNYYHYKYLIFYVEIMVIHHYQNDNYDLPFQYVLVLNDFLNFVFPYVNLNDNYMLFVL